MLLSFDHPIQIDLLQLITLFNLLSFCCSFPNESELPYDICWHLGLLKIKFIMPDADSYHWGMAGRASYPKINQRQLNIELLQLLS